MTRIFCDRCDAVIERGTIGIQISGIVDGKKDLCLRCIKQLEDFLKPIPHDNSRER